MRILLLVHAFNSLSQRVYVELAEQGHILAVEYDVNDQLTIEAVERFRPELVIAPYLRRAIPEAVWRDILCLVIHPGPVGDRGPSALDWAVRDGHPEWGVTLLQATAALDGGPIWGHATFPMRPVGKGTLYRQEVTEAAVDLVAEAVGRLQTGLATRGSKGFRPKSLTELQPDTDGQGVWRPAMKQIDRQIEWARDDTATVLAKLRSADGRPGVRDELFGISCFLFDPHPEDRLTGPPGEVIAWRREAICRATTDGAVWIGAVMLPAEPGERAFKRPAALAFRSELAAAGIEEDPEPDWMVPGPSAGGPTTWREIRYEERGAVGVLHFEFLNGAMSTRQCNRLFDAYQKALTRPTRVLVLAGGSGFWSNGMDLTTIEGAESPADESLANIEAIDDVALEVLTTIDRVTVSALRGNAGAGGAFLALGADRVFARDGVILNPHYKNMGNLYGSEYWTYALPRRCTPDAAAMILARRLPVGTAEAARLGLVDRVLSRDPAQFDAEVWEAAQEIADDPAIEAILADKSARRAQDEQEMPLEVFRASELERMRRNFYGFDPSYHVARYNFVTKVPLSRTPLHLAPHRSGDVGPDGEG